MNNAKQLLPSVQSMPTQNMTSCNLNTFDFVPQLLQLLQNCNIMIQDNFVLDMQNPSNNTKVLPAILVKLFPDWFTERPFQSMSNTKSGNACSHFLVDRLHICDRKEQIFTQTIHVYARNILRRSFVKELKPGGTSAFFPNHKHRWHRIKLNHKVTTFENTIRNYTLFCTHY
jgi:hypothetical protein